MRLLRATILALIAVFPLRGAFAAAPVTKAIPVFLSTDVGCEIDDQWPIVHLLTDPRFDVKGLASAHAPADAIPAPPAETSASLLRHITHDRLALSTPPPVFTGSNSPLADETTPIRSEAVTALLAVSRSFGPNNRLTVLMTGAATDVASALLANPTLADRIRVVAMGFRSSEDGDEFNIKNDPRAWRVILRSKVPLTVGDQVVTTRRLSLTHEEAEATLKGLGPIGSWLMRDYRVWYDRVTRTFENPGRPDDGPSWPIWDEIVVAHLLGMTTVESRPRPLLTDELKLVSGGEGMIHWIVDADRDGIFSAFRESVARFSAGKSLPDFACVTVAREEGACWRGHGK